METIKSALEKFGQASIVLLQQLKEPIRIDREDPYTTLVSFLTLVRTTSILGWLEHTSNWELGATITLKNGDSIKITSGYGDCLSLHGEDGKEFEEFEITYPGETKNFTLRLNIENLDIDYDEVQPVTINIWDIDTIYLWD